MKKQKGITLIALVITIILLLILAGVAISIVAGNEGILAKVETAVNKTNIAGAKEQGELMVAELCAQYYEKSYVDRDASVASKKIGTYVAEQIGANGKTSSNGDYLVAVGNKDADGNYPITVYRGNLVVDASAENKIVTGKLQSNGKIYWDDTINEGIDGGTGEVKPEPTDAKYFTFIPNEDGKTATITGVSDEYAEKVEADMGDGTFIQCPLVIKDGETYITDVVIPSEVTDEEGNTYTVTAIGDLAFVGDTTWASMSQFTSFVIPDTVESIGMGAFGLCVSLNSVTIGNSVTSIGENAFVECSNLNSVTLGSGVTSIGDAAFVMCTSLSSINIPDSVTSIGYAAFGECSNLKSVTLGSGVTSIGAEAFARCTSLSAINIPDSVTSIGYAAFGACTSLSTINIPKSVTNIGEVVFAEWTEQQTIMCEALEQPVTWSEGWNEYCHANIIWGNIKIVEIENNTYFKLTKLTDSQAAIIGIQEEYLEEAEDGTFKIKDGSNYITSLNIPSEITGKDENKYEIIGIFKKAFENCASLNTITIPNTVTTINGAAFAGCVGLNEIILEEGNSKYKIEEGILYDKAETTIVFCERDKAGAIELKDTIIKIDDYAFQACAAITEVTTSATVLDIVGEYAFADCDELNYIKWGYGLYNTPPLTRLGYHCFYKTSGKKIGFPWPHGIIGTSEEHYNPAYVRDMRTPI